MKKPVSRPKVPKVKALPDLVRTMQEVAQRVGVCRKTLYRLRTLPGAPIADHDDRHSVSAWSEFIKAQGGGRGGGGDSESRADAETRKIKLQNEKLQFQIGVMRRDYVPAVEVEKWGAELGAEIRKVVTELHRCAFSLVGRGVEDIEERLQQQEEQILKKLHTLDRSMKQHAESTSAQIETDEPAV